MPRTYTETVTTPAAAGRSSASTSPFVSLLSDFGLRDPSAGIMRAVVAGICPRAIVVDLAHEVDKFAIRDGALLLWSAAPYLPVGAHVAVVDPGVGTARKGIAMEVARGDYLIGPDNGLLMPAAARLGGIIRVHLLEDPRYSLPEISHSFHGRDVFAPAGAHLADGVPIEELGRAVDPRRLLALEWPRPEIRSGRLQAHAIYVDTFGNVKLSALVDDLQVALPGLRYGETLLVRVVEGDTPRELRPVWAATFGDVARGTPLLTGDSYGRVALSVHRGSAAVEFGISLDAVVEVGRAPDPRAGRQPPPPAPDGRRPHSPSQPPLARPPAPR